MNKLLRILILLTGISVAKIPDSTRQIIVVNTPSWSAKNGILQRYEKRAGKWIKIGKEIKVKVGKNGLAWGRGLHTIPKNAKRIKKEGDGRAPAGIFELPYAFGEYNIKIKYPYRKMTNSHICVDDSHCSKHYNRVINKHEAKQYFESYERMKFPSKLYSYGIFVAHNPGNKPWAGSCIFMHIQKPSGKPTVGCTAMSKNAIVEIIKWLDPKKKPLLVQAPRSLIKKLLK